MTDKTSQSLCEIMFLATGNSVSYTVDSERRLAKRNESESIYQSYPRSHPAGVHRPSSHRSETVIPRRTTIKVWSRRWFLSTMILNNMDRKLECWSEAMGGDHAGKARATEVIGAGKGVRAIRTRMSEASLERILENHRSWIGSGWEIGQRADLRHSDLHGRDLRGVILNDADMHRSDLHHAALDGAELDGADLHRADLHRATLRKADLEHADLHEADLHGADLSGALLRSADLHRADLHDAVLSEADLTDADLRGADLRRVHGLSEAQASRARIDASTRLPDDWVGSTTTVASKQGQ